MCQQSKPLLRVWVQQFEVVDGKRRFRADDSIPPPAKMICSATSNVLISDYKCALCCSWFTPRSLEVLSLLWSYTRSPGRFTSGRRHYPGRHVQAEAEHVECLK